MRHARHEGVQLRARFWSDPGETEWATLRISEPERWGWYMDKHASDATVSPMLRYVPAFRDKLWTAGYMSPKSGVLWATLSTARHADQLSRLPVAPSLVVREGQTIRRWAMWGLEKPLKLEHVERANKRIAHALGTRKRDGVPEDAPLLPVPGTTLRHGREKHPLEVWIEYVGPEMSPARAVVGSLDDPPPPRDWRNERG